MKIIKKELINDRYLICEFEETYPDDFGSSYTIGYLEIYDLKEFLKLEISYNYNTKRLITHYRYMKDKEEVRVLHLKDKILKKKEVKSDYTIKTKFFDDKNYCYINLDYETIVTRWCK